MRFISLLLFLALFSSDLLAQRVSYPMLVNRNQVPQIFIDEHVIPGSDGQGVLIFDFQFQYEFIPFKKIPLQPDFTPEEGNEYYSIIRLNSEIFKGEYKRKGNTVFESASRDIWVDTLFAKDYDETRSRSKYTTGSLITDLEPGKYNFVLQLNTIDESGQRNTDRTNVTIPDFNKKKTGEIYLLEYSEDPDSELMPLLSKESNVPFGEDFDILIRIPDFDKDRSYSINMEKVRLSEKDTSSVNSVYNTEIDNGSVKTEMGLEFIKSPKNSLKFTDGKFSYLRMTIPHAELDNSAYRITLKRSGDDRVLAGKVVRSFWSNMPASLYNLEIAIENMEYIVSEEKIKQLKKGNEREQEQKFREFWEQRDPTPETAYNELMAEYFRRVDYAFKEFRSQESPLGHKSDQGEVYIKFGAPDRKERLFPSAGKTREIWYYPNREFVFEASSGFGDFKLVATR